MSLRRIAPPLGRAPLTLAVLICAMAWGLGLGASGAHASFEIVNFDGEATANEAGAPATQAGTHPFSISAEMDFAYHEEPGLCPPTEICQVPDGQLKDFEARLPTGLVGNPRAVPRCGIASLLAFDCPRNTIVGTVELRGNSFLYLPYHAPVFNLVPGPGEPARFGYTFLDAPVILGTSIRNGGDYGITIEGHDFSQALPVVGSRITLWGVPGDSRHDLERGGGFEGPVRPFLSLPSACSGPLQTSLRVNSWQAPGTYLEAAFDGHDGSGQPVGMEGCSAVPFGGSLETAAEPERPATGAGLKIVLRIPQNEEPEGTSTSLLRGATIALPPGVGVNPSVAAGLGACAEDEIGLKSGRPARCPDASKIGGVEIVTPLFAQPLRGAIYVADPGDNPFGSLLAAYLVAEGEGVILKQAIELSLDPQTGQITATIEDMPRQPFNELTLDFFGGTHAPFLLPRGCGRYATHYELQPWSGGRGVSGASRLDLGEECRAVGASPRLRAGLARAVAGTFSDFALSLSRADGEADIAGFDLTFPAGLTANLTRVSVCSSSDAAAGSCQPGSRIGEIRIAAGAGAALWLPQAGQPAAPVYLAGPFRGAPYSLAATIPARAGPFDLGVVDARATLRLDPRTAQARIAFEALPQMLSGIPIDYREIRLLLDRPNFLFSPTDCSAKRFRGEVVAEDGATAPISERFQVGGCNRLRFEPRVSLRASGSLARNGHPALRAVLRSRAGDAGIADVALTLPAGQLLDLGRLRGLCDSAAPARCSRASRLGRVRIWSPFLPDPLQGPLHLRAPRHWLPGLVADLRGSRLHLVLSGRLGSANGRLRVRFAGLPGLPFSKLAVDLTGGRRGIVVNSEDLCDLGSRAAAVVRAHADRVVRLRPRVRLDGSC